MKSLITFAFALLCAVSAAQAIDDFTCYFEGVDTLERSVVVEKADILVYHEQDSMSYYSFVIGDTTYERANAREVFAFSGEYTFNFIFWYNDYFTYELDKITRCWCLHCNGQIIKKEKYRQ
jgi:hypothetical protein